MNNKDIRLNQLVNIVKENKKVTVKELSKILKVSEMTIRRDLNLLQSNDIVNRSYGKATYIANTANDSSNDNYELDYEQNIMNEEKERIGKYAASLIEPGDVLIIDGGSTTDKLAKHLPEDSEITVLCYTYNILSHLIKKDNMNLIFSGGYYHRRDQMFESLQGINLIENIRATKMFVSTSGIHHKLGLTCSQSFEVPTKRTALQSSQTKILVADSSKFSKVRTAYFAQLNEINEIVTDTGLSSEWKDIIESMNIRLHIV
ncbi:DeoR/GlpR family DNA-binding transcription regulator [Clostridium magnum]|uniref:Deoxyribose operon repressor n=1 Tax=Clostridium magnum DSM 2767 TaxID=1121326 RepID=A0A162QUH3_9CLOT|nr:DeoR/GlpR family DNA-binding transcription regulator [Clostridium magnum]KZL88984.1 deoxyribose operon repressor [Clostridium magnum DSM 2767]SHI23475.1 transcriptional regulator, DeoR family [Clostridium magnum DSM 2767]